MATLVPASIHACVTDPPYHLTSIVKRFGGEHAARANDRDGLYRRASTGFMGQTWDGGDIAFRPETWRSVYRLLKPGGYLLAFNHSRTWHRMTCAIEDAGFEIRDTIMWLYGSGFPKSHDVSKGIDRHNGATRPVIGRETIANDMRGGALLDVAHGTLRPGYERHITSAASAAWEGWGTALKPAVEPIVMARKPLDGTVAANVLKHGTGAINIADCRIDGEVPAFEYFETGSKRGYDGGIKGGARSGEVRSGRWPANIIHDGSDEVLAYLGDAARFFYSAKADADDRLGSKHPTVKPTDLMAYLCRMVTRPGGMVLDPFGGSGSTGMACLREGFDATLIEQSAEFVADIKRRIAHVSGADTPLFGAGG